MDHRYDAMRAEVRRVFPAAKIKPHGVTLVAVYHGDEQISRAFSEPERAWADACRLARANAAG